MLGLKLISVLLFSFSIGCLIIDGWVSISLIVLVLLRLVFCVLLSLWKVVLVWLRMVC